MGLVCLLLTVHFALCRSLVTSLQSDFPSIPCCCSIGPLVLVVCSLKSLRCAYSDTPSQYCVLALTQFAFNFDYHRIPEREMFILNYALMLLFYSKVSVYNDCHPLV